MIRSCIADAGEASKPCSHAMTLSSRFKKTVLIKMSLASYAEMKRL